MTTRSASGFPMACAFCRATVYDQEAREICEFSDRHCPLKKGSGSGRRW